jgi:hypothetical protein
MGGGAQFGQKRQIIGTEDNLRDSVLVCETRDDIADQHDHSSVYAMHFGTGNTFSFFFYYQSNHTRWRGYQ